MKTYNYKYNIFYLTLLFIGLMLSGCEKDDEISNTPSTLFRPLSFSAYVNGADVGFTWIPIANASYVLEISRDSLLFETDLQQIEIEEGMEYSLENLYSRTQYSARIKSVSMDGTLKDSGYSALTFTTGTENIFYTVSGEALGLDFIKVSWNTGKVADKIVICDQDTTELQSVMLTSEDIENGELLFENLNPGTTYIYQIYNGDKLRGTMPVSTYALLNTVEVDETKNGGWDDLGSYYLLADPSAFVRIRNDGSTGYVIADAFKFTRGDYEIIVDNSDDGVIIVGYWAVSSYNSTKIGDDYAYDAGTGKGEKSFTYPLELPESGVWQVSMHHPASSAYGKPVPVDIYAGDY